MDAVVVGRAGGRYRVYAGGEMRDATLRGRLKHQGGDPVLVGDRVHLTIRPDGAATIDGVAPRASVLRRRSPGRGRGERAVAANVHQVVVVGAAREPAWDPNLIDRFAAVAEANHLPLVVVINKADLAPDAEALGEPYRRAGYAVLVTSAKTGLGIPALHDRLGQHVSLFTGPTGVGKSSLLNTVLPGLALRTGSVSPRTHTGRHTTVAAEMHPLGNEGFVVDTPGLRDIGLWGLAPLEVSAAFPEFAALPRRCRFDNCRHRGEPDCAVADAVASGELARSRYDSYRRMLDEAELAARPWA